MTMHGSPIDAALAVAVRAAGHRAPAKWMTGARAGDPRPRVSDTDLARWAASAVAVVPGADALGVVERAGDGSWSTRSTGGAWADELDRCQFDGGEGPTLDALARRDGHPSGDPIGEGRLDAAAAAGRWPVFAPAASAAGVASVLAFGLIVPGAAPVAATFYGTARHAFDDPGVASLAGVVALEVATLVLGAHRAASLRRARSPRDLVALAKGLVMERFALDDAAAFAAIVRCARDTGTDLLDVALQLAEGAEADDPGGRWHDARSGTGTAGVAGRRVVRTGTGDGAPRREALATARDALAQRRDGLADTREDQADERESVADRREQDADRRDTDLDARESAVDDLAHRAGFTSPERLTRADDLLERSHGAVDRLRAEVRRSQAALRRVRDLQARDQQEVDRETQDSVRRTRGVEGSEGGDPDRGDPR